MLRASALTTGTDINVHAVNGSDDSAAVGVSHGRLLMRFAEAFTRRDAEELERTRQELEAVAGAATLVDAAGVVANMQRAVRIADAMGIPVDASTSEFGNDISETLQLTRFASARHTLTPGQD